MRPTGVTIIDRAIGGFPTELPLVVEAGSGRTRLALALADRALARGESVRILTSEAAPSLLRESETHGFALASAFDAGRLEILELHGDAPKLLCEHGAGPLTDALCAELPGRALIVVDPFSALVAEIPGATRLREVTRAFADALVGHDVVLFVEPDRMPAQRGLRDALAELGSIWFRLPEATKRASILVVDDDRLQREMLRDWLSADHEVVCAADGFEAFAALLAEPPDLVVLDLVMPRVSGQELLQSMRRARFDMPVLVTSSRIATAGERLGPLALGATEFLAKPITRVELLHKVETLLRLPRSGATPRFGDSQREVEALFGSFSRSRLLESAEFADRVERACTFGSRYGLSSSLLGIAAGSAAALDRWIDVANQHLRFEDAVLRADKQVAAVLLVATDPRHAPRVLERLRDAAGEPLPEIETLCRLATPAHAEAGAIEMLLEPLLHPSEAAT